MRNCVHCVYTGSQTKHWMFRWWNEAFRNHLTGMGRFNVLSNVKTTEQRQLFEILWVCFFLFYFHFNFEWNTRLHYFCQQQNRFMLLYVIGSMRRETGESVFLTFSSLLCVACVSVCFVCLFCNKSNWMHYIKVRETVWFAFFISCVVHEKQPQQQQQQKSYWHENASISSIPLLLMVCLCALCVLTIICARSNLIHEPSGYVSYLPKIQVNWISWQQ